MFLNYGDQLMFDQAMAPAPRRPREQTQPQRRANAGHAAPIYNSVNLDPNRPRTVGARRRKGGGRGNGAIMAPRGGFVGKGRGRG